MTSFFSRRGEELEPDADLELSEEIQTCERSITPPKSRPAPRARTWSVPVDNFS